MLRQRQLIIGFAAFAGIILIGSLVWYLFSTRSAYSDHQQIANLSDYTNGKPSDRKSVDYIKYDLFRVINLNTKSPKKSDSIKDVFIRDDSFEQKESKDGVHDVSFIVDIKSLKQSYSVKYQWADEVRRKEGLDEWGTMVSCLPLTKLKYGDFNCVDDRTVERGVEASDPVGRILPHTVKYKYTVTKYNVGDEYSDVEESKRPQETVTLDVEAFVPSWQDEATVLAGYEAELRAWLQENKLDPNKYAFNFIY